MLQTTSDSPTTDVEPGIQAQPITYRIPIWIGLGVLAYLTLPFWICVTFVIVEAVVLAADSLAYKRHSNPLSIVMIVLTVGLFPLVFVSALMSLTFFWALVVGLTFLVGMIASMLEAYAIFGRKSAS